MATNGGPKKFSEEADAAVAVLRAIVNSKKGASTVQSVLADFRELEGGPLMYKRFGFPCADEFLKATGEFVVQSRMGEPVVFAKLNKESAHIMKMVAAQRTTRTKKSGFAVLRQPQKRTGGSWNPSAYNKMYGSYPAQRRFPPQQQQYQRNHVNQNNPLKFPYNSQPKPLMSLKVAPPAQSAPRIEANNNTSAAKNLNRITQSPAKNGQLPQNDLRHRLPPQQQQRQLSSLELKNRTNQQQLEQPPSVNKDALQKTIHDVVAYNAAPPPTRTVNSRLQVSKDVIPTSEPVIPPEVVPVIARTPRPVPHPMILTPPSSPVVQLPTLPGRKTLQDRLKINQQVDSNDLEKVARVVTPQTPPPKVTMDFQQPNGVPSSPQLTPPSTAGKPFRWDDPYATPVELLVQYAQHHGFVRPIYKYFRLKNQRFQCRVTVNGSTYSTYPSDYANEFECQFAAARIAIENIRRDEERNNYSVCPEDPSEIANKIYELLLSCPGGMFSAKIPDVFLEAYGCLLPDQWEEEILQKRPLMFVKENVRNRDEMMWVYFANQSKASEEPETKTRSISLIALPWEDGVYWSIYVTNPVSTMEIWARMVGADFSKRMDDLSDEIEMQMMDDSKKRNPETVTLTEYYLVCIDNCWHRVRAEEVDVEKKTVTCFLIDWGEREKISLDEIYECDTRFLELPAQSVCFSLDKLEDFNENPRAKPHLDNLLCGKVCIGQILTSKDEYKPVNTIKVMLYDTSGEDDINLNELILKHICNDTPVPELQRTGVTAVVITHVDDEGNVYCQLKDPAMVYLQTLINNLVQSDALEDSHRGLYNSIGDHQLFLVRDVDDQKWYRARKEAKESGSTVSVLYVDFGIRKKVQSVNLFRLQSLSTALSRFPAQAIKMKIFDVSVNEYWLSRLRALLKPGLTAMVRVAAVSGLPLVKLYSHYGTDNILVCLNDSIRAEMELETNSEVICDPRVSASEIGSDSASTISSARTLFSSPVPSQVVPRLTKCPLPGVGDLFDVTVTIASSPNYFIVQPYKHAKELNQLMVDLQAHCKAGGQIVPPDSVQQGEAYAGFDSDDGNWYRVLVVNILGGPTLIHGYFCDFGQIKMLDSKMLRVLPQPLRNLPQQAVKAKLYGVQPRHGDWSTEDAVRFQQLTVNKKFASYIRSVQADEISQNEEIVELELIDVSTAEDVLMHRLLVDEGRAVLSSK